MGIEGVKIEIDAPENLQLSLGSLDFILHIHTKTDQLIESVEIKLIEKYGRGWGSSKLIDEYILYDEEENLDLSISTEEKFSVSLSISFEYIKSSIEKLGDHFLLKPLSKLALLAKRAKSSFRLEVRAKVKGVRINPLVVHRFDKGIR